MHIWNIIFFLIFYFYTSFKALKNFEAPQSVTIKIYVDFLSSSAIGTGRVKITGRNSDGPHEDTTKDNEYSKGRNKLW